MAIGISLFSLFIATIALGWNIYRDVILKPRLRLSLMNGVIASPGEKDPPRRVTLTITNFGPGKSRPKGLHLRKTSWWRRILRRQEFAFLMQDYEDPLSGKIPCELEVGAGVTLTFRHLPNIFLEGDFNQIGVVDSFGKTHWCSRQNYREVKKSYFETRSARTRTAAP